MALGLGAVLVGVVVALLAVVAGSQPRTDAGLGTVASARDDAAAVQAEKELMRARDRARVPESLTPWEEIDAIRDRARARQERPAALDGAASLQDEIELMRERNRVRARTQESLTPRQEHELLVGR